MGRRDDIKSVFTFREDRRTPDGQYFIKERISGSTRIAVALRYGCTQGVFGKAWCVWCGAGGKVRWEIGGRGTPTTRVTFPGLELDHVIPEFRGGSSDLENIVLACRQCNRARGHKGSYQPEMKFPAPRIEEVVYG